MYIYTIAGNTQLRVLNRLGYNEDAQINIMPGDGFNDSKIKVPQEKWFCFEWHVTSSMSEIFLDGMAGAAKRSDRATQEKLGLWRQEIIG